MDVFINFLRYHWLSITVVIGIILAVAYVYRNKKLLMIYEDDK